MYGIDVEMNQQKYGESLDAADVYQKRFRATLGGAYSKHKMALIVASSVGRAARLVLYCSKQIYSNQLDQTAFRAHTVHRLYSMKTWSAHL